MLSHSAIKKSVVHKKSGMEKIQRESIAELEKEQDEPNVGGDDRGAPVNGRQHHPSP